MVWSFLFILFKRSLNFKKILGEEFWRSVKKVWKSAKTILPFRFCSFFFSELGTSSPKCRLKTQTQTERKRNRFRNAASQDTDTKLARLGRLVPFPTPEPNQKQFSPKLPASLVVFQPQANANSQRFIEESYMGEDPKWGRFYWGELYGGRS